MLVVHNDFIHCSGLAQACNTFQFLSFSLLPVPPFIFPALYSFIYKTYKVNYVHILKIRLIGWWMYKTCNTVLWRQGTLLDTLSTLDYNFFSFFLLPFCTIYIEFSYKRIQQFLSFYVWLTSLNIMVLRHIVSPTNDTFIILFGRVVLHCV